MLFQEHDGDQWPPRMVVRETNLPQRLVNLQVDQCTQGENNQHILKRTVLRATGNKRRAKTPIQSHPDDLATDIGAVNEMATNRAPIEA